MSVPLKWQMTVPYGMEPVVEVAQSVVGHASSVVLVESEPEATTVSTIPPPTSPLLSWTLLLDED